MTRWLTKLLIIASFVPVLVGGLPASAQTTQPSSETSLVGLVNAERSSSGLGTLTVHPDLVAAARRHAEAMADRGRIYHSENLAAIGVTGWTLLGENVAMAPTIDSAHRALMNSPSHRDNVLEKTYTHIGIGVVEAKGTLWIVQMFMASKVAQSVATTPTLKFIDVPASVHQTDIYRLATSGITRGCASTRYCPASPVTREQIATFLVRALNLGRSPFDIYIDDSVSPHQSDINAAAAAGIITGCAGSRYCPTSALSRADMAVFLVNALGLPAATADHFSDDNGWPQEAAINALADAGVTNGCTSTKYCPGGSVTRAQMASYLVRAFDL